MQQVPQKQIGNGPLLRVGDTVKIKYRPPCECGMSDRERKAWTQTPTALNTMFVSSLWKVECLYSEDPTGGSSGTIGDGDQPTVGLEKLDAFDGVDAAMDDLYLVSYNSVIPDGYDDSLWSRGEGNKCPKCGKTVYGPSNHF